MDVRLAPEKEAQLQQLACRTGRNAEQVVEEAVDRLLEYDAQFAAAVEEGREAARECESLDHDEVVERIERMLHS
jgi:predicted transcriptional regulator